MGRAAIGLRLIAAAWLLASASLAEAGYLEGVNALSRGDYQGAFDELQPLAERGDADAQFTIGFLYDYGQGVERDYAIAAAWYHKAAVQNHTVAQFTLAAMFESGKGVPKDLLRAYAWYGRAAAELAPSETRDSITARRDTIAAQMPEQDLARARAMTLEDLARAPQMAALAPTDAPEVEDSTPTNEATEMPASPGGEADAAPEALESEADEGKTTEPDKNDAEPSAPFDPLSGVDRPTVARAQAQLADLGYRVGAVDGVTGPQTRKAITAFAEDRGLVTIEPSPEELLAALEIEWQVQRDEAGEDAGAPAGTLLTEAELQVLVALDERLFRLEEIIVNFGSAAAAVNGWGRVEAWAEETKTMLANRLGGAAVGNFDKLGDQIVIGDPYGNFTRVTGSYRDYLAGLRDDFAEPALGSGEVVGGTGSSTP